MSASHALGQHAALSQVNATLREGEMMLDTRGCDRVTEIF